MILPDLAAGCSMADMADDRPARDVLGRARGRWASCDRRVVPVTYINSAAAIKAFCGERGGIVCTSSTPRRRSAGRGRAASASCFLPDQHLGRNTAYKMGVPLDEMVVWDPNEALGRARRRTRRRGAHHPLEGPLLGAHALHRRGRSSTCASSIRASASSSIPSAVRGRCRRPTTAARPSTSSSTVSDSPPGSVWAVGTEIHLVNRLAREVAPDTTVLSLDRSAASARRCSASRRTTCCGCSRGCVDGEVHNRIVVPEEQKHWAKVALDRMLSIQ